jgi:DNA-binding NarL/FixJ family response regulator
MRLLGDGRTTSEIAAKLKVSIKTVQEYCARLKQKMGAANIRQLVRIAVLWRAGIVEIVVKSSSQAIRFRCGDIVQRGRAAVS